VTGRLASKVVVVTSGGTGIGRAVAARAAADGAAVVIGGRRKDVGDRAAAELRESGGRALFVASDVTVEADVARLVETAVRVRPARRCLQQRRRGGGHRAGAR